MYTTSLQSFHFQTDSRIIKGFRLGQVHRQQSFMLGWSLVSHFMSLQWSCLVLLVGQWMQLKLLVLLGGLLDLRVQRWIIRLGHQVFLFIRVLSCFLVLTPPPTTKLGQQAEQPERAVK